MCVFAWKRLFSGPLTVPEGRQSVMLSFFIIYMFVADRELFLIKTAKLNGADP